MTTETIKGYRVTGRKGMNHWKQILEEWILLHERYCRVMDDESGDGDAVYLYNERANVGLLAAAAWRGGMVCLQDAQYEKGYRNKPKWPGYADLYLAWEGDEETIEAKFKWASLTSNDLAGCANSALSAAMVDISKTLGMKEMRGIGVAFIPLHLKKSNSGSAKEEHQIDRLIQKAIGSAMKTNSHAIAWVFPIELRQSPTPGVILFASNSKHYA